MKSAKIIIIPNVSLTSFSWQKFYLSLSKICCLTILSHGFFIYKCLLKGSVLILMCRQNLCNYNCQKVYKTSMFYCQKICKTSMFSLSVKRWQNYFYVSGSQVVLSVWNGKRRVPEDGGSQFVSVHLRNEVQAACLADDTSVHSSWQVL